jgi:hydrogenase maturation factor HypF (carbamoyltransferase family)
MADHQGVIVEEDHHLLAELLGDSAVQAVHYRPADFVEVVLVLVLVAEDLLLVVPEKQDRYVACSAAADLCSFQGVLVDHHHHHLLLLLPLVLVVGPGPGLSMED